MTTMDDTVAIGYGAQTQNTRETRLGVTGGFQFYSETQGCSLSDDTDVNNVHTDPLFKIPAGAIIHKVTATVTQLSNLGTYNLAVYIASDSGTVSDGTTLSNTTEILGAGEASTFSYNSSSAVNINGASGGLVGASYCSKPNIGVTADRYVWVTTGASGNGDTNPTTNAGVRITVFFSGQD